MHWKTSAHAWKQISLPMRPISAGGAVACHGRTAVLGKRRHFKLRVCVRRADCVPAALMDKQAWIAITLSVIGLVAWQTYIAKKYPPVPGGRRSRTRRPRRRRRCLDRTASSSANPPFVTSGQPDVVADRKEAAAPRPPTRNGSRADRDPQIRSTRAQLHEPGRRHLRGGSPGQATHRRKRGQHPTRPPGQHPHRRVQRKTGRGCRASPITLTKQGDRIRCVAERTEPERPQDRQGIHARLAGRPEADPRRPSQNLPDQHRRAGVQGQRLLRLRRQRRAHPPARPAHLHRPSTG